MLVTCLNCLTSYELDDALVPPQGAAVQCTRCQHTFIATRPALVGVHPALLALLGGSSDRPASVHFEGPVPLLSDASCERAGWFLWVRSLGAGQPPEQREQLWRRQWGLRAKATDALVACAERCSAFFMRHRQTVEMARFFDHELCRLELAQVCASQGLRTSSPVARILLRGACAQASADTWWVELEGPAVEGKSQAVITVGLGREGVAEDTPEGCFALLPDSLAESAPERLRARYTQLR